MTSSTFIQTITYRHTYEENGSDPITASFVLPDQQYELQDRLSAIITQGWVLVSASLEPYVAPSTAEK